MTQSFIKKKNGLNFIKPEVEENEFPMSHEWGILPIPFFSLVKDWHSHIEYEIAIVKTWEIDIPFFSFPQ